MKMLESVFICLHIFECPVYWERTGTSYLEDYLLGGLYAWRAVSLFFFCVSLSFMSPWLDQLSLRYHMVYAIYLEIIIPIPYFDTLIL
jgi:hypothetical protein